MNVYNNILEFNFALNCFKSLKYHTTKIMAKSKYEYVKSFEMDDKLLPNSWIVVRLDGKGFHKFADSHGFSKPNDERALNLMNQCARTVMENFREIVLSYGQSDEYSFIFRKDAAVYGRRSAKIMTTVNSLFTSSYVYKWSEYFGSAKPKYPPSFDARVVLYPSDDNLRDYLCWRQADVHINNMYNTCFWSLVLHKNLTTAQAEERLRGTLSSHKNELLFSEFGINYNNEPVMFRKGSTLLRKLVHSNSDCGQLKHDIIPIFSDFFRESFWKEHPELLGQKPLKTHYVLISESSDGQFVACPKSKADLSKTTVNSTIEKGSGMDGVDDDNNEQVASCCEKGVTRD